MVERNQITRVSDTDTTGTGSEEQNNLTLTGICTQDDVRAGRTNCRSGGSDDNYVYFGGTERDNQAAPRTTDGQRYEGSTRVTVNEGDTLWKLAEQKYGGKHPLEAIYAANGLYPKVNEQNGRIEMSDATYGAGKSYILPDEKDIPALTKEYRQKVEEMGRSSQKRVGEGVEESNVKLIYGDTFNRMARAKYGHDVPMEAIYEANGLRATYTEKNGELCTKDPIYYAGKTYKMPAEKDIPELTRKYWERVGHPERCPEEFRRKDGNSGTDNYGYAGETDRDRGRTETAPPQRRDNYGDYGDTDPKRGRHGDGRHHGDRDNMASGDRIYNEGYEDGYNDAMRRRNGGAPRDNSSCVCGGGGCYACRGPGSQRDSERYDNGQGRSRHTRETCGCEGAGCPACMPGSGRGEDWRAGAGRGRDWNGDEYGRRDEYDRRDDRDLYPRRRDGGCGCGGAGCDQCAPRRRQQGCQNCGGGGCNACYGTEYGPRRPRRYRQ